MLNKNDVAMLLKVHINTVNAYVKNGMPNYKVGKNIRFDEDEVIRWFKKEGK